MNNQVFDIVQAMSGQGNCITIPGPYLDFFAGDRQQHLLAAILNQLVFWSGKSSLDDGWFYKEHAALAKEIRAKDGDVVRKAMFKITEGYLSGVIEEELRQVSVPFQSEFADILMDDPIIEPPRLIFCSSESDLYDAIVSEVVPQDDGTCEVTARQYRAEFYDYDNATYPGDAA